MYHHAVTNVARFLQVLTLDKQIKYKTTAELANYVILFWLENQNEIL